MHKPGVGIKNNSVVVKKTAFFYAPATTPGQKLILQRGFLFLMSLLARTQKTIVKSIFRIAPSGAWS